MATKIINGKAVEVSIENNETAPLFAIRESMPETRVPLPNEEDMRKAKYWVDCNEK